MMQLLVDRQSIASNNLCISAIYHWQFTFP